jgi:tRNA 2-thiouridine synthesizing protein D
MKKTTLTFALMDAPYENSRTVTAFRLIQAALAAGHDVNVFAYEGAVALPFARQAAHANAVHGRDGVGEAIEGVRRGTPADFWKMSVESGNTLTIGTR